LCREEELLLQKIEAMKNKVEESPESNYELITRKQSSNTSISFFDYNAIKSSQAIKNKNENSLLSSNNSSLVSPSSSYTTQDEVYNYNNNCFEDDNEWIITRL
jgi:hypothetical protein